MTMLLSEYKEKISALQKEYQKKKQIIDRDYALSNNPHKIGETISDHIGKGIIKSMEVYTDYSGQPAMRYRVDNLTKRGTISKRESERYIYQRNLK